MSRADTYPHPQATPFSEREYSQPLQPAEAPQLSVDAQLENAHRVVDALQTSIEHLRDKAEGERCTAGIDTTTASLPDVTRSIIRGIPISLEPTDMQLGSSMARETPVTGLLPHDRLARALGQLLRGIAPSSHQIGYVTTVADGYDTIWRDTLGQKYHTEGALYPEHTRTQFVLDVWNMQKREGIITPRDEPGRDYTIVPTSPYIGKTDLPGAIIHDLRRSNWGEVGSDENGALVFRPGPELRDIYGIPLGTQAIRLTDQFSLETSTALYAQSVRETLQQRRGPHLMGPNSRVHEAAVLLRAIGDINRQRYHSVGVKNGNWGGTTPNHYALAIALELEQHAQEFIHNRQRFADFKKFDPNEYANRWYGQEQVLVDDQNICRAVGTVLRLLNMHVDKAVDIGCGPNLYPGMLMLPYADKLDLLDFAPTNREYVTNYLTGNPTDHQLHMWDKFVTYMIEGGGTTYTDIPAILRRRAQEGKVRVEPCDVFNLEGMWELMSAYFVIDSISTYTEDQYAALASMANSLTAEGVMIVGSMLNQKGHVGYKAGDNNEYPNLSQTPQEMKQTFLDNNLFPLTLRMGQDQRKERDGYDGMAVTFACHRGSERQKQLISLIPELQALGFDVVA